jgi:hypothetical protein
MKSLEVGENCIMMIFIICTVKYNYNDEVKEDKMGSVCSTNGD